MPLVPHELDTLGVGKHVPDPFLEAQRQPDLISRLLGPIQVSRYQSVDKFALESIVWLTLLSSK